MSHTKKILLTGITGSIGSWIARKALLAGDKLLAVVRADSDTAASSRVQVVLDVVGAGDFLGNVEVLRGDICLKGLGLESGISNTSDISLIIHCAAVLEFGKDYAELNRQVNVAGTANVLELAETLRVPICHISTAYIAGKRSGIVYENEIDVGQEFHNAYEQSKCRAENLVRRWSQGTGLDSFIFRPSIVVGDTVGGRIMNFDGLYNLMRFFDNVGSVVGKKEFRAVGNPETTKNFVPVDYVADAVWHIIQNVSPGTYHITNPSPIRLSELRQIFADLFDLPGARFVHQSDFQKTQTTRLERMYQEATSHYLPYLMGEPVFDRTNTNRALTDTSLEVPKMDIEFFSRLLDYARRVKWGKRRSDVNVAAKSSSHTVERYFEDFLVEKMNKQLLPNLRSLSATCRINVEDVGRSWALKIEQGRLVKISHNSMDCQCAFFVNFDTFCRIVSGRLVPQKAFFKRKVDIQGDMETGLKLATVLSEFFQKWPYHPGAKHGR
jgi:thioester reductase-like protein/predicted lipid carrier protein YhbT